MHFNIKKDALKVPQELARPRLKKVGVKIHLEDVVLRRVPYCPMTLAGLPYGAVLCHKATLSCVIRPRCPQS